MRRLLILAALSVSIALPFATVAEAQVRRNDDIGGFRIPGTTIRMFPGPRQIIRFGGATLYDGSGWGNNYPQSYFTWPRGINRFDRFNQFNGFSGGFNGFTRFR